MFERSKTDKRRVIIVDFNHMAWAYAYGQAKALSCTININGVPTVVNTTIPAYTIKRLNNWANNGSNPLAVCFDGTHSSRSRKAYFTKLHGVLAGGESAGYKAGREVRDAHFYDCINMTCRLLLDGGVSCYKAVNYEADDLIKACVDNAKLNYPDLPIDVITGDCDLIPLVDEQVSVFIRDKKTTYATEKGIEKQHYFQVTPENYQEYLEQRTAYKGLEIPYNSLLLVKLLRGDKSDGILGKKDWKPKMYNYFIELLQSKGHDFGNLFRYSTPEVMYYYKGTTTEIPREILPTLQKEQIDIKCGEPPALEGILDLFRAYCEPDDIEHVRRVYNGINLNGAFLDLPPECCRLPAKIQTPIQGYVVTTLQASVSKLMIDLKLR